MHSIQRERIYTDIGDIIKMLKRNVIILVLIGIIFSVVTYAYICFNNEDLYMAKSTIYINENADNYNDYVKEQDHIINDYIYLIKSHRIIDEVIERLDLSLSYNEINSFLSVNNPEGTYIIDISITCEKPFLAQKLSNEIAAVFKDQIESINKMHDVEIISMAEIPTYPIEMNIGTNVLIAFIFGFLVGLLFITLKFILADSIKNMNEAELFLQERVLAKIERDNRQDEIRFLLKCIFKDEKELKTLLFVNVEVNNENNLISLNIAKEMRESGKKIFFVNIGAKTKKVISEMNQPMVYNFDNIYHVKKQIDEININNCFSVNNSKCLDLVLLEHTHFKTREDEITFNNILNSMKEHYDAIIINYEYKKNRPEYIVVSEMADASVMAVECNFTSRELAQMAKKQLLMCNDNLKGIVLCEKKHRKIKTLFR